MANINAGADLTGKVGLAVKLDANGKAVVATDDTAIGILRNDGKAGEEVGVAVQGPDFYVDDELYICRDGTRFCVIGNSRGCCRTLKGAVRKLNKMLKERANNEV